MSTPAIETSQDVPLYLPQSNEREVFSSAFRRRLPLLIKGPTGCGKTRFVRHMAATLGRPLYTVACHDELSAADLVGRFLIRGEETVWQDGPLTRAVRDGGICYLDEVVEARKDTTVILHPLTDDRGESPGKPPAELRYGPVPFWPVVLWGHPVPPGIKVTEPIPEIVEPEGDEDSEQLWKADDAPQYREDAPEQAGGALESGVLYPEWNCRRGEYRDNWCCVHEQVPDTIRGKRIPPELRELANRVRRRFEALRMQERWRRHLSDGEEVDTEAFIDALCERRGCGQSDDRLFRHRLRLDRDLSVAVLLDVSNSTHGWVGANRIIDIAQHALVVLAEALDELQDDFALYAFSSLGRAFVDCWRIKGFHENYNGAVGERVLGLKPHGSTRMGAAVRHVGAMLERRRSRHRLLLVLTDGRPYDPADRYLGRYALEDTRRALVDLHARGVAAFGLTIDREGCDYLPCLFGPGKFLVFSRVEALPEMLPRLYARLTGLTR